MSSSTNCPRDDVPANSVLREPLTPDNPAGPPTPSPQLNQYSSGFDFSCPVMPTEGASLAAHASNINLQQQPSYLTRESDSESDTEEEMETEILLLPPQESVKRSRDGREDSTSRECGDDDSSSNLQVCGDPKFAKGQGIMRYIYQKRQATNEVYDLRQELDGVRERAALLRNHYREKLQVNRPHTLIG